ncbi:MAG: hypothetical protein JO198_11085 [Candidatus Dormibacteraeota bacterium]|nr:hypothetical protein [Candidatus Dormibacteraeota bacterium]
MKLLASLVVASLASVAVPMAAGAGPVLDASARSDGVLRSIDNMHLSRDLMCTEQPAQWIDAVVAQEAAAGANTIVVDTPYDDASGYRSCPVGDPLAYEETWVSAIRHAHLHVWFRQVWNSWLGIFGQPKLTYGTSPAVPAETGGGAAAAISGADTSSYLARTYGFIVGHPGLFASGDIFTPAEEPEGGGVAPDCTGPCQFPNPSEFNRFMRDSMAADRQAFASLGLAVAVGYWGVGCANHWLEPQTVAAMGVLATDCYDRAAAALGAHLTALYQQFGVPVVLGEWGDIWDRGAQPASNDAVSAVFATLNTLPFVLGFNYWQAAGTIGSEDLLNTQSAALTPVGATVRALLPQLQRNTQFTAGSVGAFPVWLFTGDCAYGGQQTGQLTFACRFPGNGRGATGLPPPLTENWPLVR